MKEVQGNQLFWTKTKSNAIIPTKGVEDAGYSIYAYNPSDMESEYVLRAHRNYLIPTGVAVAMSKEYYLEIVSLFGFHVRNIGLIGMSCDGIIDSNYREEIVIPIVNTNPFDIIISPKVDNIQPIELYGDTIGVKYPVSRAIAQLVVHKIPVMESKELSYEEFLSYGIPKQTNDKVFTEAKLKNKSIRVKLNDTSSQPLINESI